MWLRRMLSDFPEGFCGCLAGNETNRVLRLHMSGDYFQGSIYSYAISGILLPDCCCLFYMIDDSGILDHIYGTQQKTLLPYFVRIREER